MISLSCLVLLAASAPPRPPTIVAVSAGASRGVYQAGVLYSLLNASFEEGDLRATLELAGLAGTSSGAINALLAALESCSAKRPLTPDESLLWQLWRELSWGTMFPGDLGCGDYRAAFPWLDVSCSTGGEAFGPRDGMITASSLTAIRKRLRDVLADTERFKESCTRPLTVSVTAEQPATLRLGEYKLQSSRRQVSVELRTQKGLATTAPRGVIAKICQMPLDPLHPGGVAGSREEQSELQRLILPVRPDHGCERVDPDLFLDVIFASASEPNLLPPVELNYCSATACTGEETRDVVCKEGMHACRSRFLDGSFFDRQPLYAALAQASPGPPPRVLMLSTRPPVDPSDIPPPSQQPRGFAYYLRTLNNFFTVAGEYELQMLERYHAITKDAEREKPSLDLVRQSHPLVADLRIFDDSLLAGALFPGLASFFDLDFRRHDYYVGIHDGLKWLQQECRKTRTDGTDEACPDTDHVWAKLVESAAVDSAPGLGYIVEGAEADRPPPWIACQLPPKAREALARDRSHEIAARRQAERVAAVSCALETAKNLQGQLLQSSTEGARDSDQFGLFAETLAAPIRWPVDLGYDGPPVTFSFDPGDEQPYIKRYRTWRYDLLRQALRRMGDVERSDGGSLAFSFGFGEYWAAVAASTWRDGFVLGSGTIPQRIQHSALLSTLEKVLLPSTLRYRGRGPYLGLSGFAGEARGEASSIELAWDLLSFHFGYPNSPSQSEFRHHIESQFAISTAASPLNYGISLGYAFDPLVFPALPIIERIPQLGARVRYSFGPELPHAVQDGRPRPFALDVFARPFYGRLEAGVRWSHLGENAWAIYVGVGDLNGLIYWCLRSVTGADDTYHSLTGAVLGKAGSIAGAP